MDKLSVAIIHFAGKAPRLLGIFRQEELASKVAAEHLLEVVLKQREQQLADRGKRWAKPFAKELRKLHALRKAGKHQELLEHWRGLSRPPEMPDYYIESKGIERDYHGAA